MPDFRIFTESKADIKFLRDFIEYTFHLSLEEDDFDTLGSWSGYKAGSTIKASIKENAENEKTTVLILDADNNFNSRKQEVLTDFEAINIRVHLFLFPNNNSTGSLENVLCEIASERKIISCFEEYQICVSEYQSPLIKSKIFAYLDALLPTKNKQPDKYNLIQDANRDFKNTAHWNLQHEYLNSLKEFFTPLIEG